MATASLLDEFQTVFEKGHESWKSYFSRWEVFAKYEEDLPESELFTEVKEKAQSSRQKKVKHQSQLTKPTALPSLKYKRSERNKKKIIKKKRVLLKSKQNINATGANNDQVSENLVQDMDNVQLESLLKTVFTEIIKGNKSEFQMFSVLSQTFSSGKIRNSHFFHQQALACYSFPKPLEAMLESNTNVQTSISHKSTYMGDLNKNSNLFKFSTNFRESEEIRNSFFKTSFPKFEISCQNNWNEQQFLFPFSRNQSLMKMKFDIRSNHPAPLNSPSSENTKLKSLEWDLSLKSQNSICGKINEEHFIKGGFHKMNMMEQDGKRLRDLCLRKRTNSVTLSMENSNFITPERKPPERKCFSENILQGKRKRPSKLFFDDEEEDSESDDQTEKQTLIIHCKSKKPKIQTIPEVVESDSDDCENIFDRVNKPDIKN